MRNAGEWADQHRILPIGSPEPGPWRTDRTPFWKPIYSAIASGKYQRVVIICGSQMGKTEALLNVIGHRFTDGPFQPVLYVGPTEKFVRSLSRDRIHKMLQTTPVLMDRTERGHRYGVFEKWIAGVRFGMAWAGSPTELAGHPAGLVVVDERDRMGGSSGDEGDPVTLAEARSKNFPNRLSIITTTPTLEGASPGWDLWEQGTMQMFAWPCLGCGTFFVPHITSLQWQREAVDTGTGEVTELSSEAKAMTAAVVCPKCGHRHTSVDNPRLNAVGAFLPFRQITDRERSENAVMGRYVQAPEVPERMTGSFWISGLASPWVSFEESALKLIQAYATHENEKMQAVINTEFGELFRVRGDAPSWEEVGANRTEISPGAVPSGVQKITAGCDVQRDGIFYVIRGWGYNAESWLLEHGFLAGETEHEPVWQALRQVLTTPYKGRKIDRAFIDSGYRPGDVHRRPDHAVYTFCRSLPSQAYPTKGQESMETPFRIRAIDYTAGGAVIKGGVKLVHIDTDYFKRWLHARIRWPKGQSGEWHLHRETSDDYCRQMVSEELVLKPSGRAVWVRRSRSNHYLDAEVNATAAGYSINVHKLAKPQDEDAVKAQVLPTQKPSGFDRRGLW